MRSSVDLPAPLGPTSPMTERGATTRSTPVNRVRGPWPADTPRATSWALTTAERTRPLQARRSEFTDQPPSSVRMVTNRAISCSGRSSGRPVTVELSGPVTAPSTASWSWSQPL